LEDRRQAEGEAGTEEKDECLAAASDPTQWSTSGFPEPLGFGLVPGGLLPPFTLVEELMAQACHQRRDAVPEPSR
jgi:hypothetical protein